MRVSPGAEYLSKHSMKEILENVNEKYGTLWQDIMLMDQADRQQQQQQQVQSSRNTAGNSHGGMRESPDTTSIPTSHFERTLGILPTSLQKRSSLSPVTPLPNTRLDTASESPNKHLAERKEESEIPEKSSETTTLRYSAIYKISFMDIRRRWNPAFLIRDAPQYENVVKYYESQASLHVYISVFALSTRFQFQFTIILVEENPEWQFKILLLRVSQ